MANGEERGKPDGEKGVNFTGKSGKELTPGGVTGLKEVEFEGELRWVFAVLIKEWIKLSGPNANRIISRSP